MTQNKLIIGLTGGTGCGKTTVCSILKKYGAYIIDADKIAHSIIKNGQRAYFEIIDKFGKNILDENNEINRQKLGVIVFSDIKKLDYLNSITHKYIIKNIVDNIENIKNNENYNYIVIDAPLLIETKLHKLVDTVWVVNCSIETRIKRLEKRDNINKDMILKRIDKQMKFEKLKNYADFIINNEDDETIENIENIVKEQLKKGV